MKHSTFFICLHFLFYFETYFINKLIWWKIKKEIKKWNSKWKWKYLFHSLRDLIKRENTLSISCINVGKNSQSFSKYFPKILEEFNQILLSVQCWIIRIIKDFIYWQLLKENSLILGSSVRLVSSFKLNSRIRVNSKK